jgi:hypothetical protein
MTKETSLIKAGRDSEDGAALCHVKKGEHGALLFGEKINFLAVAHIPWKTFTTRLGQGTHSPAAWPDIWQAR